MRRLRLLLGRGAVAEDPPLARSHLEKAEVLAVVGVGAETRLAARHLERLVAVRPEDSTDHVLRRFGLRHRQPAGKSLALQRERVLLGPLQHERVSEFGAMDCDLASRLVRKARIGEQPLVAPEERERLTLVLNALCDGERRPRRSLSCGSCARRRRQRRRGNHYERKRA